MGHTAIREAIYARRFSGHERTRVDNGPWIALVDQPHFAEIMELVGMDLSGVRMAHQQVKGWKKDVSAKKSGRRTTPSAQIQAAPIHPVAQAPAPARGKALVLALGLGLLAWLLLR
jgi:hypothetical protein